MRIYKRISLPPSSCGCWCCCFPHEAEPERHFISFLSGEDGAAVLLCALLTENYGAFLLGMLLIYLFFGAMVCLWKHVPPAALLTGLIFTIMPTVDFLKTEILKEHFLPWDMLLAKNADSFTTFLSALKIPTPLWWLWGGTVAYLAVLAILRPTLQSHGKNACLVRRFYWGVCIFAP
ncbi:MAG: hypothetical protein ACLSG1_08120 [Anaerotignum faecicola]